MRRHSELKVFRAGLSEQVSAGTCDGKAAVLNMLLDKKSRKRQPHAETRGRIKPACSSISHSFDSFLYIRKQSSSSRRAAVKPIGGQVISPRHAQTPQHQHAVVSPACSLSTARNSPVTVAKQIFNIKNESSPHVIRSPGFI